MVKEEKARLFDRWTSLSFSVYLLITLYIFSDLVSKFFTSIIGGPPWHVQELHAQGLVIHSFLNELSMLPHLNYFYPLEYTIALSEPRILIGWIGLPVYLLTKNFIASFNFAYLMAWPLCGLGAFLMCRAATKSAMASFIGGLIYCFGHYELQYVGQISLLYSMFVPPGLAVAWYYGKQPSWKWASLLALLGALQLLACAHYACYLLYGAGVLAAVSLFVHKNAGSVKPWIIIIIAGVLSFISEYNNIPSACVALI